jgi:hypothetical protein
MVLDVVEKTRICKECGEEKPITSFSYANVEKTNRLRVCIKCIYWKRKEKNKDNRKRYYQNHKEEIKAKVSRYHYENWDKIYERHKEVRKERTKEYYWNVVKPNNLELYGVVNSPEQMEKSRQWRERNRKEYGTGYTPYGRKRLKERYIELRTKAINIYGGKCECCGENRYDMLTFDHKKKIPTKDKVKGVKLTYDVIREYEKSGYPNEHYQLLCWNCNMSKGFYGYCPHSYKRPEYYGSEGQQKRWLLKIEVFKHYGNKCEICGETLPELLTIDHINGGGTKHREKVGNIYKFLRNNNYPSVGYRILCANCNCSQKANKYTNGGTLRLGN